MNFCTKVRTYQCKEQENFFKWFCLRKTILPKESKTFSSKVIRPILQKCFCPPWVNCHLLGNNSKCDFSKPIREFKTMGNECRVKGFLKVKVGIKKWQSLMEW